MKKLLFISLSILLFSACVQDKGETVSLDDIAKPSDKDYSDTASTVQAGIPVYYDSVSVFSRRLIDSLSFRKEGIFKLDTLIYPDRFGAEKADKWCYVSPKDSFVFMRWEFKNNVKTQNTFFNWLDSYGPHRKSIAVGDEVNFSKRATMFLVNDKELIFIESGKKIDEAQMLLLFGDLKKQKKWDYFILQQPKGKAAWRKIDDQGQVLDLKGNKVV